MQVSQIPEDVTLETQADPVQFVGHSMSEHSLSQTEMSESLVDIAPVCALMSLPFRVTTNSEELHMRTAILCLSMFIPVVAAYADLHAGTSRVSITPLEAGIPTQLGGYGERNGVPATGIHDTIYAKVVVLKSGGTLAALVGLDICTTPRSLVEETIAKAAIPGLTYDNVIMSASHDHAGLEGMSMDRNNVVGNPHIGIFSEEVTNFVSDRVAGALKEAHGRLEPVTAGTGVAPLRGMNRNRRHDGAPTDEDMTVVRLDRANGTPLAVLVNYTAHGTIMTEKIMEVSGGWAGVMQRTVEDLVGSDVLCLYTNGSEGDVAPRGYTGGSRWEMAEQYGRRVAIAAAKLSEAIHTGPVTDFAVKTHWVTLPPKKPAPDFLKIAGDEYQVSEEQLGMLLEVLFPSETPLYGLRINDFHMITIPGEPITAIGLAIKQALRDGGSNHPVIAACTNDHICYILTKEEYHLSGYEVTASFYGDGLGEVFVREGSAFAAELTR
jgi:neutral ceramidase